MMYYYPMNIVPCNVKNENADWYNSSIIIQRLYMQGVLESPKGSYLLYFYPQCMIAFAHNPHTSVVN